MKKSIFLLAIGLSVCYLVAGQNYRIYGFVRDSVSGEVLIGASIYDTISYRGTITNKEGYYSFELPDDKAIIAVSFVGYKTNIINTGIKGDSLINVNLIPGQSLNEVIVTASSKSNGVYNIDSKKLNLFPALGGEPDIMKFIQTLPGIQPGYEGSGDLNVRGGGPGENLIQTNRVPLYYINHLGGFVSIFNPYIINDAKVYTGNFPAEYGGRLSSVLDVTMKNGNTKKIKGSSSLGLISSKIALDGPVNKKLTFIMSARRTYLDAFLLPLAKIIDSKSSTCYNFFDVNIGLNLKRNEKNSLQVVSYFGDDRLNFKYKDDPDYYKQKNTWGNAFISFHQKSILSPTVQVTNQLVLSRYRLKTTDELIIKEPVYFHSNQFFYSGIQEVGIRSDWQIYPLSFWDFKSGIHFYNHRFAPAVSGEEINNINRYFTGNDYESIIYLDNYFFNSKRINIRAGLRLTAYFKESNIWTKAEPRLNIVYNVNKKVSLTSAYSRMNQFVHQLRSTGNMMNPQIWLPVMKNLPPSSSDIYSIGTNINIKNSEYSLRLETYYRHMENLVEYREGELYLNSSTNWVKKLESNGTGISYGAEMFLEKKKGTLTGNFAYTYSRSFRQFENVNQNKKYPFSFDRPHNLNINLNYSFNENITLNTFWILMSGLPVSLPVGKMEVLNNTKSEPVPDDGVYIYSERNAYRMKVYHRLDVGINIKPKKRKRNSSWTISVYNIYNRQNPYYYQFYYNSLSKIVTREVSFFPIIPSFCYNLDF